MDKETLVKEAVVKREASSIEVLSEMQQLACEKLKSSPSIATLWQGILAFEHYPFTTTSGLAFTYEFKLNRHGQPGNEIMVSRKEKTITRSSVEKALGVVIKAADEQGGYPVKMFTPKELGAFGASYIYPLFIRFGLVEHVGSDKRGGRRKKE